MQRFVLGIFLFFNLIGMIVVVVDKYKSMHHQWRIPERVFFTMAALGAGLGIYGGCLLFRHKTKHTSFMWGLPAILILQGTLILWLYHWTSFQ